MQLGWLERKREGHIDRGARRLDLESGGEGQGGLRGLQIGKWLVFITALQSRKPAGWGRAQRRGGQRECTCPAVHAAAKFVQSLARSL